MENVKTTRLSRAPRLKQHIGKGITVAALTASLLAQGVMLSKNAEAGELGAAAGAAIAATLTSKKNSDLEKAGIVFGGAIGGHLLEGLIRGEPQHGAGYPNNSGYRGPTRNTGYQGGGYPGVYSQGRPIGMASSGPNCDVQNKTTNKKTEEVFDKDGNVVSKKVQTEERTNETVCGPDFGR